MVAYMKGAKSYSPTFASLESPLLQIDVAHCLTVNYFVRSNLTIATRSKSHNKITKLYEVCFVLHK